ncbi:HPr kinase/phosphorylase [Rhizobium paknamense]|uniref:Serine kinase of HPr protein (Carbohydrate metabolism regulator) n=1 Tax=Rhizobium paknamense TaxID=1206817 RepID=A0ABU0IIC7_9HYPH|nr:HPr kinase/phosphatase C-terminal domain-containing protein [Rhizobium paknamense]MDQ0457977.1 serine kinase of HPr protein (carbohydrate metabolism regulator) [Rhizobium paknamense]
MKNDLPNHHATVIEIDGCGLLISGPSGCGKSRLALELLTLARMAGRQAFLVADDQVFLEARAGKIIAHRPPAIAGLMEARFSGLIRLPSIASAVLRQVILPVADESKAERLPPEDEMLQLLPGINLPVIRLVPGVIGNLMIVDQRLGLAPC